MEGAYLQEPQNYIDCFLKKIEESKNDAKSVYTSKFFNVGLDAKIVKNQHFKSFLRSGNLFVLVWKLIFKINFWKM